MTMARNERFCAFVLSRKNLGPQQDSNLSYASVKSLRTKIEEALNLDLNEAPVSLHSVVRAGF